MMLIGENGSTQTENCLTVNVPLYRLSLCHPTDCHCATLPSATVPLYRLSLCHSSVCHCATLPTVTVPLFRLLLCHSSVSHCATLPTVTLPVHPPPISHALTAIIRSERPVYKRLNCGKAQFVINLPFKAQW